MRTSRWHNFVKQFAKTHKGAGKKLFREASKEYREKYPECCQLSKKPALPKNKAPPELALKAPPKPAPKPKAPARPKPPKKVPAPKQAPAPKKAPPAKPAPPASKVSMGNACLRYKTLREIYNNNTNGDFRPPQWVEDECGSLLAKYASSATVLYVQGDSLDKVKRLALEREPVNIAMEQYYDKRKLKEAFGYESGAYGELSKSKFPPQIAISCVTPVQDPKSSKRVDVAVVNLIGLAFDDDTQPDYDKLIKDGKLVDRAFVLQFMTQAYVMAFHATALMGRKVLCASPIGNVSFKPPGYTTLRFEAEFVWPAIAAAHKLFPEIKVERAIFGYDPDDYNVPGCFFNGGRWSKNLKERMFINAWDCWSMLGNGNSQDRSADGWWGRSSAISLLGWPGSNPIISYENVKAFSRNDHRM